MRKMALSIAFMVSTLLLINCSPKTKPASSDNSNKIGDVKGKSGDASFSDLPPEDKLNIVSKLPDADYSNGYTLYQAKCGTCHELHDPKSRDFGGWLKIMISMSKKAKLSDSEYKQILGYLYVNGGK